MTELERLVAAIKSGKQRGRSWSIQKDGDEHFCSVAIQKHGGFYKVYFDVTTDRQYYNDEDTEVCSHFIYIQDALDHIKKSTGIEILDLKPCRGQKLFDPRNF